ncbi:MAG: hypothetical protein NZM25_10675 [Leptospiraceae bacterium]|nr:hypothetical protein [Leptospiraceae bacterium]MDW8305892.1 hypothetical protein [Leptospiraceae bacterium]
MKPMRKWLFYWQLNVFCLALYFLGLWPIGAYTQENGRLLGELVAVGEDGGLEAVENPAYLPLRFQTSQKKWLVSLNGGIGNSSALKLGSWEEERWEKAILAYHELGMATGAGKWASGFYWGRDPKNAWQDMVYQGNYQSLRAKQAQKISLQRLAWALGFAFEKKQALAFSLATRFGEQRHSNLLTTIPPMPPITAPSFTYGSEDHVQLLGGSAQLAYLTTTGESDLGISCRVLSVQENQRRFSVYWRNEIPLQNQVLGFSAQRFDIYTTRNSPRCTLGISYVLWDSLRAYGEYEASLNLKERDKFYDLDNTTFLIYETQDPSGMRQKLALGAMYPISLLWSIMGGVSYSWNSYDRNYRASDANYRIITIGQEKSWSVSLGASYRFRESMSLVGGIFTRYFRKDEEQLRFALNQVLKTQDSQSYYTTDFYLAIHLLFG